MRSAQVALLSLLRSWPGLLLLCSQHATAFRALIDSLHVDRPELRVSSELYRRIVNFTEQEFTG